MFGYRLWITPPGLSPILLPVLQRRTSGDSLEYPPEMGDAVEPRLPGDPGHSPIRCPEQGFRLADTDIIQILDHCKPCRLLERPAQIRRADEKMLGNASKCQPVAIMGIHIFNNAVDPVLRLTLLGNHHRRLRFTDAVQPDQQLKQQRLQIRPAPQRFLPLLLQHRLEQIRNPPLLMGVGPEQKALSLEHLRQVRHNICRRLQEQVIKIDQNPLMPRAVAAGCTVQLIFVDEDQIACLQGINPVMDIIMPLPGQQIIDFIGIMEMISIHIEITGPPKLLHLKKRLHTAPPIEDKICIL